METSRWIYDSDWCNYIEILEKLKEMSSNVVKELWYWFCVGEKC